jgi:sialate O-acetylesterase
MKSKLLIAISFFLILYNSIFSQIRLPKVINNNMVLQREKPVPIWGWDTPGEKVTVQFEDQTLTATTDASGYWKVILSPLKASAKPAEMKITGSNTITLTNILAGEVWLCSGQSNMEYPMKLNPGYLKPKNGVDSAAIDLTNPYPNIRLFSFLAAINYLF